jgi:5-methylcytosine-specific restriction endonuclease McrA
MKTAIVWHIPKEIMIDAANKTLMHFRGYTTDKWGEKEKAFCRDLCGRQYGHIETDWVGKAADGLRKKGGVLISVNGGQKRKKYINPHGKYAEYLDGEHWKAFRLVVMDFWEYKCCLCRDKAKDVHHNNYLRVGCERLTDCVALCRTCHMKVNGKMEDGNEFFNYEPDQDELF